MPYLVLVHATFNDLANATHIDTQARTVAMHASVARIGEPGERTSHGGVYEEQPDGTLVPVTRWHIDRFGIVRDGALLPDDQVPDWVQPLGAQDAYPLNDVRGDPTVVQHDGQLWRNTHGNGNVWAPGVFGWAVYDD